MCRAKSDPRGPKRCLPSMGSFKKNIVPLIDEVNKLPGKDRDNAYHPAVQKLISHLHEMAANSYATKRMRELVEDRVKEIVTPGEELKTSEGVFKVHEGSERFNSAIAEEVLTRAVKDGVLTVEEKESCYKDSFSRKLFSKKYPDIYRTIRPLDVGDCRASSFQVPISKIKDKDTGVFREPTPDEVNFRLYSGQYQDYHYCPGEIVDEGFMKNSDDVSVDKMFKVYKGLRERWDFCEDLRHEALNVLGAKLPVGVYGAGRFARGNKDSRLRVENREVDMSEVELERRVLANPDWAGLVRDCSEKVLHSGDVSRALNKCGVGGVFSSCKRKTSDRVVFSDD